MVCVVLHVEPFSGLSLLNYQKLQCGFALQLQQETSHLEIEEVVVIHKRPSEDQVYPHSLIGEAGIRLVSDIPVILTLLILPDASNPAPNAGGHGR